MSSFKKYKCLTMSEKQRVIESEEKAEDHNNTESDKDKSEELTPMIQTEAKVSLKKLRNVFLPNDVAADVFKSHLF
ncbi:hypothetical protein TNCV_4435471 [Trichonephila clavipes]|nr:hypothetical protein TNCV_4435471 [Trichonephila clavipes]